MTTPLGTVLLSDAMHAARATGASDLHLMPNLPPVLRVDGSLQPWSGDGMTQADVDGLLDRFLDAENRERLERTGDATTTADVDDTTVRIHASRGSTGTTFTLRFLSRGVPSIEELGVPVVLREAARKPYGLLLLGGPTGSGKSTTLAALVATLNDDGGRKIIMVEDPIEYRIASRRSLVVQRQTGRDVPSFADAVVGALRSDPDVIVIGEIRDAASVSSAITAAETGHLVMATLHAADAAQCVERLLDVVGTEAGTEPLRGRIAHVLIAAASQRLIPRADGTGRCLATEVLVATDAVRHLIREGKYHHLASAIATGRRLGMQTLEASLGDLVAAGIVAKDQAERVVR